MQQEATKLADSFLDHNVMRFLLLFAFLFVAETPSLFSKVPVIMHDKTAKGTTLLAVKELQRYIYVRTGELPSIKSSFEQRTHAILIGTITQFGKTYKGIDTTLQGDAYQLLSIGNNLLIIGATEIATLYGAYKFLESTGIGFTINEDIIPDEKLVSINLSGFNKIYKPAFALRGIQPFHDFPEGPDWWNEEDYKAIITQLPKMGMNFIGFHTYPYRAVFHGWSKAEPIVWIGTKDQFDPKNGNVSAAYPVLHSNTNDSTWNYYPKKTSDFSFGAAQLFETDNYGADYMKNVSKWPHTTQENIDIFNKVGQLLNRTFTLARDLGVKTCIGTETPLTIPGDVKKVLRADKKDTRSDVVKQELYEAIFSRIKATHPLDYYWLWTNEGWTWDQGESVEEVNETSKDLKNAVAAAKNINAPFTLGTCGWVLGPSRNRAEFDEMLPKEMPFGVINRLQGYTVVEPAFANIKGRPKWEITWLEDDPALITPQFWAGRTRKDAQDAYKYGCTGLMGIHWRTKGLSPAFMALAKAGWEADTYTKEIPANQRDYPVDDLYYEWATLQFGKIAAKQTAAIFENLDGAPIDGFGKTEIIANFPRSSAWGEKGPGIITVNKKPWSEVEKSYNFISEFEKCKSLVQGTGNQERYDYWLQTFYYARTQGHLGCILGEMDTLSKQINSTSDTQIKVKLANELLAARDKAAVKWGDMVTHLLQTVSTTGEMGTIANIEQHNMEQMRYLVRYDSLLRKTLANEVQSVALSIKYSGPSRLVVSTKQTNLHSSDGLNIRVRVLTSSDILTATIFWKQLGSKKFKQKLLTNERDNVYRINLNPDEFRKTDFEYYIEVKLSTGSRLKYPSLANSTETVILW